MSRFRVVVASTCMLAVPGTGQAQSIEEEVRKIVNNSVSRTVSQVLEETLTAGSSGSQMPSTTVFLSPIFNHSTGDFGDGDFEANSYGGLGGALQKVQEMIFLHGSVGVAHADIDTSEDITAYAGLLGGNYILLRSQEVKAWVTLEGVLAGTESDDDDLEGTAWLVRPSITGSFRPEGNLIIEPSAGFSFADVFGEENTEVAKTLDLGLRFKFRHERWRPQLNFSYFRTLSPDPDDDGIISAGAEVNYRMQPGQTIGIGYSYSKPIDAGYEFDSHTVFGNVRWTF